MPLRVTTHSACVFLLAGLSYVAAGCSAVSQQETDPKKRDLRIIAPSQYSKHPSAQMGVSEEEVLLRLERLRDWFWSFISLEGEFYVLPFVLEDRPVDDAITKEELLALPLTAEQKWSLFRYLETDVVWENDVGRLTHFRGEPTREERIVKQMQEKERRRRANLLADLKARHLPGLPVESEPDLLEEYAPVLTDLLPLAFKAIEEGRLPTDTYDPWVHGTQWAQRIRHIAFLNGLPSDCQPNDVLCDVAMEEQAGDPSKVVGYVDYIWYRDAVSEGHIGIPSDLISYILVEYVLLRQNLPPHFQEHLGRWDPHVSDKITGAEGQHPRLFWFRSVIGSTTDYGVIEISPVLVRAAFLQAVGSPSNGYSLFYPGAFENLLSTGYRNIKDLDSVSSNILNRFIAAFRFALAHEMAHIYLGRGTGLYWQSENRVDCYAVWHLQQAGMWDYNAPGLFESLMGEAVREGSANVIWGDNVHWKAVEDRLSGLDDLANTLLNAPPEEVCSQATDY